MIWSRLFNYDRFSFINRFSQCCSLFHRLVYQTIQIFTSHPPIPLNSNGRLAQVPVEIDGVTISNTEVYKEVCGLGGKHRISINLYSDEYEELKILIFTDQIFLN